MSHKQLTRREVRDWIVRAVRQKLRRPALDAEFTFLRLPAPDKSGATWWLHTVGEEMLTWTTEYLEAFGEAVEQAQQTFDLSD